MFTLSFGKILVVVLVVVAAWRGYRLLQQIQTRLDGSGERRPAAGPTPRQTTDLVECPRCGLLVPNGTTCRSVKECRFRGG
jgi:hypothetical protein